MRTHSRRSSTGRWLGAGAGLFLAGAIPAISLATPPERTTTAAPAAGTTTTQQPGTASPAPSDRPATAPVPTHPPRTGTVPGADPTRPEAGAGSTTVATDAPPVPGMPAREKQLAQRTLADLHQVNIVEITLGRLGQDKAQSPAIKEYAQQLVTDHESAEKKVRDFATAHDLVIASAASLREPAMPATDTGLRRPSTTTPGAGAGSAPATAGTGAPGTTSTGGLPGTPGAPAGTPGAVAGTSAPAIPGGSVSDQSPAGPVLNAEGRRTLTRLEKLEGVKFEKQFLTAMVSGHQKTLAKLRSAERRAQTPALQSLLGELRTSVESHLEKARNIQKGNPS
jgi:predicted outer membrane protein